MKRVSWWGRTGSTATDRVAALVRAGICLRGAWRILGTAANQVGNSIMVGKALALMAGILEAVSPIIARDILQVGRESAWIESRAIAEAIKSECFRLAAADGWQTRRGDK
jgi:hypothetical protein